MCLRVQEGEGEGKGEEGIECECMAWTLNGGLKYCMLSCYVAVE
jgi:hypothetical protein